MSKKHYKAIAEIIKETEGDFKSTSIEMYQAVLVSKLCVYFKHDNDRFDSVKFREAIYGKD